MLLERLQQSLHTPLHTRCTERGLQQHPAFPTPACSASRMKGTGIKSIHKKNGSKLKMFSLEYKALGERSTGRTAVSQLLSGDGLRSGFPSR